MSDDVRPIVIKRIKKNAGGHHGGAWKLAYADFMTAMMAFFLLMWLLGSVSKGSLKGISDYFANPVKVASSGGSGSGDATSLVPGGGEDLSRQTGQVSKYTPSDAMRDRRRLSELKKKFEALMDDKMQRNTRLAQYKKQLLLDMVADKGTALVIQPQFGGALVTALARIGAGEYGACTRCGNDIAEARLDVLPWTPFCPACAGARARQGR